MVCFRCQSKLLTNSQNYPRHRFHETNPYCVPTHHTNGTVFIGTGTVTVHDVLSGDGCSLGLVALLVCATVVLAAGSGAWATGAAEATASQSIERDSVLMRVDIQDDGSATWRIEYRTRLDDPNTTQAFRDLQADIDENPETYSTSFFDGINSTVATAENATDREMTAGNYSVNADVRHLPRRYGVVVYKFTWRGFAVVDGKTIEAGDALAGFFLGENERLLLTWPASHEFETVEPSPDDRRDRSVIWTGPMEFGPNEPRLVVTDSSPFPQVPWIGFAVLAGLLVTGAGAWWLSRRRSILDRGAEDDATLLSNEERVIRVLEKQGGRAKQQEVVDALDWTEAKTSRVISTLREQDRVDSFRLGRENVVTLADTDE